MTNRSRDVGTWTAEQVVRYLQPNGFPFAERRALHGNVDKGDIVGLVGLCVEVKGGKAAEQSSPADLEAWQQQTLTETRNAHADVGVLITKRKAVGATRVGDWWAWLYLPHLADAWNLSDPPAVWLRLSVADAVVLLRHNGYGSPLEGAA